MDVLFPFRHVHTNEMDPSSMATVSNNPPRPVHDGLVGDSSGVDPSLRQHAE